MKKAITYSSFSIFDKLVLYFMVCVVQYNKVRNIILNTYNRGDILSFIVLYSKSFSYILLEDFFLPLFFPFQPHYRVKGEADGLVYGEYTKVGSHQFLRPVSRHD